MYCKQHEYSSIWEEHEDITHNPQITKFVKPFTSMLIHWIQKWVHINVNQRLMILQVGDDFWGINNIGSHTSEWRNDLFKLLPVYLGSVHKLRNYIFLWPSLKGSKLGDQKGPPVILQFWNPLFE